MSVFQRMTPAALAINAPPVMVKPPKKATPCELWVSKYAQNPFGVHLKEHRNPKKSIPRHLRTSKKGHEARRISISNIYHHKTAEGNEGKNLRQSLGKKKLHKKETVSSCITWSPKPRKLKEKFCQDTILESLEENTFYPLTQKEGRRYVRRRFSSIIVGPTLHPLKAYVKHPKKRQHRVSVNDAAELTQFKDLLKKKGRNEVDILALPVHHHGCELE